MIAIPYVLFGLMLAYMGYLAVVRIRMTPAQRKEADATEKWGPTNPTFICPHCQTKSSVRTKAALRKKGVSGSKAAGAILTGGASVLVTGLSRKEATTQAHCDTCSSTWDF